MPARPSHHADRLTLANAGWLGMLASLWGLSFLFVDISLRALSPVWIVATRTTTGSVVLLLALFATGARFPRSRTSWLHIAVLATTSNAAPWTLIAWAQQSIPSGLAALVIAMVPTATLALSVAVGAERLTPVRLAGLLVALGGVAVIVTDGLGDTARFVSLLVAIGAALLYAVSGVYAKRFVSGYARPLEIATAQVLCAGMMMLPIAIFFAPRPNFAAIDTAVIGALATLGILGTGVAYILLYVLIERAGATNTSLVAYIIPVVAVVAGTLVLGEHLGWRALVGGALVVAGIWLSQRRTRLTALDALEMRPR